ATGYGSALVENLIMGDVPAMTSVYHLDGADLRMTHYCGARNQPRLKATRIDEATATAEFALVDVTGVGPSNPGYVQPVFLQFPDADRGNTKFPFGSPSGKTEVENIPPRRVHCPGYHPLGTPRTHCRRGERKPRRNRPVVRCLMNPPPRCAGT